MGRQITGNKIRRSVKALAWVHSGACYGEQNEKARR